MPRLTRLLVVETPFSRLSTGDANFFEIWKNLVEGPSRRAARGAVLRSIDPAKIDVVLLGMEGLTNLSDPDTDRLRQFTERGGRTILAANHFFVGTVAKANGLLVPYGLRMTDTESLERLELRNRPGISSRRISVVTAHVSARFGRDEVLQPRASARSTAKIALTCEVGGPAAPSEPRSHDRGHQVSSNREVIPGRFLNLGAGEIAKDP